MELQQNRDKTRDSIALFSLLVYAACIFKSIVMLSVSQVWYLNLLVIVFVLDHKILLMNLEEAGDESKLRKWVKNTVLVVIYAALFVEIYTTIPYYNSMNYASRSDSKQIVGVKVIKDKKMNPVQTVANGSASKTYKHICEEDLGTSRIVRFSNDTFSGYYDCLTGKEIFLSETQDRLAGFNGLLAMEKNSSPGTWVFKNLEGESLYEDYFKNVEALDHCSYLCECNDGHYVVLNLQDIYRNADGHAIIIRIVKPYRPEIIRGEIVVFISDQEKTSLVYINERKMNEGNAEDSHWIRCDNNWKSNEVAHHICDIDIESRSYQDNVLDSIVYSFKEEDGKSYGLGGFGENFHECDLMLYEDNIDDTGAFIDMTESELRNEYAVPVKPDEEGYRWIYGLQIF